jgi:hypothetical protein
MAARVYTAVDTAISGLDWTAELASADCAIPGAVTGDSFVNTGKEKLVLINASAANTKTVSFDTVPCNYGIDHTTAYTTPISNTRIYGPFPVAEFGAIVYPTYAGTGGVTDVKVMLLRDASNIY